MKLGRFGTTFMFASYKYMGNNKLKRYKHNLAFTKIIKVIIVIITMKKVYID
jgi:hypothetical protein